MGRKTNKIWLGIAIAHFILGILATEIGDHSGSAFEKQCKRIRTGFVEDI